MAPREPAVAKEALEDDARHAIDVEKLGRQRPDVFPTTWHEVAFVASILGSLAMADFVISGFQVVLPALVGPFAIAPASQTWPSSVLTLVAGAFLFPLGRLADMYGGCIVFNCGLAWFCVWVAAAGFSQNFVTLVVCRAMQGLGTAAFLPAGISLLARIYRPGPRKNLVFALYGSIAPLGFFSGIIIGGLSQDLLSWRWYFWLGGILTGVFCVGTVLTSPRDYAEARRSKVQMDWWGTCTTVPGLMFFVYALTESTNAPRGWASPAVATTFSLGVALLAAAVYVEGWVAEAPLIPADIFRIKYMKRMLFCLLLSWGVFSMYLFYTNFYIQLILGKPALLAASWFSPWAIGGLVLSTLSGLVLHVVPGRVLLVGSGVCKVLAVLFFALMPDKPSYWAWVLPAMLCEGSCIDVLWTVSNVFLTTSLPRHQQGLAGAVISITLFVGGALALAIADVAKGRFEAAGMDLKSQYKGVFWIGVGLATMALASSSCIKLGKAGGALTVEERERQAAEAVARPPVSRRDTQGSEATAATSDADTVVDADEKAPAAAAPAPPPESARR